MVRQCQYAREPLPQWDLYVQSKTFPRDPLRVNLPIGGFAPSETPVETLMALIFLGFFFVASTNSPDGGK
jgi:hypothetical protein